MKVLGIDYGEKRIGLAVSDELGMFARGLCTLVRKNISADLRFIGEVIAREQIATVVFGLPLNYDGSEGIQCAKVRRFASRLIESFPLPNFFVDEVLSTEDAKEIMSAQPRSRRHARTSVDRIAAAIILQRYLDKLRD